MKWHLHLDLDENELDKVVSGGWSACLCIFVEGENTKWEQEEENALGEYIIWGL